MAPIIVDESKVRSFPTEAAFEAWLAECHDTHKELWLRIYKRGSDVPTVTPVQALDVALCWGWIDGVRKGLDEVSFLQRYTPRKKNSVWSQINRDNIARLIGAGRMTPHGQRHVEAAQADGRWAAAYGPMRSSSEATLPADLRAALEANPRALAAVQALGRPNLFALAFQTNHMRTAAGRAKKVATLVAMLARGEAIVPEASRETKADGPAVGNSATKGAPSSKTNRSTKTTQDVKAAAPIEAPRHVKPAAPIKAPRRVKAAAPIKAPRPVKAAAPIKAPRPVKAAAPIKAPRRVKAAAPIKAPRRVKPAAPIKAPRRVKAVRRVKAAQNAKVSGGAKRARNAKPRRIETTRRVKKGSRRGRPSS